MKESLYMVVGMITHLMPSTLYLSEELWIATYIVCDTKERGFDPEFVKLIQYPRCHLGYRTIIERKVDATSCDSWDTPSCPRDKHTVPHRYTAKESLDHLLRLKVCTASVRPQGLGRAG